MMTPGRTMAQVTLWVCTAVGALLVLVMLRPFAESLVAGAILAVAFHAPHKWIERWISNANGAASVSTILMILVFLAPLSVIVPLVAREVKEAVTALNASGSILDQVAAWLDVPVEDLRKRLQDASGSMLRQGVTAIGIATGGVIQMVVTIATFFFVVRDGVAIHRETVAISPLGRERTEGLLLVASEMIHASVYGVMAVAVAQGLLCGIGAWIAGLPLPAMWGLATAAASVIPLVGSALVWIPAVIMLFMQGQPGKAVFMLAWGAGIVGMADNVVRPWILASRMPINPLLVMVSMLGSAQVFGLIGFVAGPVALAIFLALLRTLREEMATESS